MNKKLRNRLLNKTIHVIKSCENMKQLSTARKYVDIAIPFMDKNHISNCYVPERGAQFKSNWGNS